MDNTQAYQLGQSLGAIVVIAALIALYIVPTILAFSRTHHYRWRIFGINLFLGWSVIGWLGSFAWAVWPRRAGQDRLGAHNARGPTDGAIRSGRESPSSFSVLAL